MKSAETLFKTYGEAAKFCEKNGFDDCGGYPWALANKILAIKKSQTTKTINACIRAMNSVGGSVGWEYQTTSEYQSAIHRAICEIEEVE